MAQTRKSILWGLVAVLLFSAVLGARGLNFDALRVVDTPDMKLDVYARHKIDCPKG